MENKKIKIAEFYKKVFSDSELKEKLEEKVKKITNEEEFKKLIREEIMPLMKKFKVNFSEEELLEYEEETFKKLSKEDLFNVSGGMSIKPALLAGGVLSIALLGGGVNLSANAAPPPVTKNSTASANQNLKYAPFVRWFTQADTQLNHILDFLKNNVINTSKKNITTFLGNLKNNDLESFTKLESDTKYLKDQIQREGPLLVLKGSWNTYNINTEELNKIVRLNSCFEEIKKSNTTNMENNDTIGQEKGKGTDNDANESFEQENNENTDTNSNEFNIEQGNDSDIEPIMPAVEKEHEENINENNNNNGIASERDDNNENNLPNINPKTTAESLRKAQQNWEKRQMEGTWNAFDGKKFVGVLAGKFSLLDKDNLIESEVYEGNTSCFNEFLVETPFGQSIIKIRYLLNGNELVETSRLIVANNGHYTTYEEISTEFNRLRPEEQKTAAENILKYFNIEVTKNDQRNPDFVFKNKEQSPLEKFNRKVKDLRTILTRGNKKIENQVLSDFCAILMFCETAYFRNPTGGKFERGFVKKLSDILDPKKEEVEQNAVANGNTEAGQDAGADKNDGVNGKDFSLIDTLHAFYLPSFNHEANPPGGKEATKVYIENDGILPYRTEYQTYIETDTEGNSARKVWGDSLKKTVENMDELSLSDDSDDEESAKLPEEKLAIIQINLKVKKLNNNKETVCTNISIPVYAATTAEMLANKYAYLTANEKAENKLKPDKIRFYNRRP